MNGQSNPKFVGPAIRACAENKSSLQCLSGLSRWTSAFKVQAIVIRNAIGIITCAWITNACFTLGNIFSGKFSTHQSGSELIVANMSWFAVWYIVLLLASHIPAMRSLLFIDNPHQLPTLQYCIKRLLGGSFPYLTASLVLSFCLGSLVAYFLLSSYKLDMYLAVLCTAVYNIGIGVTFRRIFFMETREGQERLLVKKPESWQLATTKGVRIRRVAPISSDQIPQYRPLRFWPVYLKIVSETLGLLAIGMYVHLVSRQSLAEHGVTWFMVGSVFSKLAIQEFVKHYVLKTRLRDMRTMCVLVGLPTVLIDTQTRILLLDLQNNQFVVTSTIGMAVVEIISRVMKAVWLTWTIRRRGKTVLPSTLSTQRLALQSATASGINCSCVLDAGIDHNNSTIKSRCECELWRKKCLAYHAAEIYAEMYAEYIAIGCSASVLFLLGGNAIICAWDFHVQVIQVLTKGCGVMYSSPFLPFSL